MMIGEVMAAAERERWTYVPSISVGPLRFGMSPAEAAAALGDLTAEFSPVPVDNALKAEFRRTVRPAWLRGAVTAYFGESEGLFCVVVDAQSGPQVVMDGVQRAGDVVLTRPVFAVAGERAYTPWDAIPGDELQVH
jgi:hypothetical protein